MKKLHPVNIQLDGCVNDNDYTHRLTECVEQMSKNTNIINLVKVHIGDNISVEKFNKILKEVAKDIKKNGG